MYQWIRLYIRQALQTNGKLYSYFGINLEFKYVATIFLKLIVVLGINACMEEEEAFVLISPRSSYASPSSGDSYSDCQLIPNFDF